MGEEVIGMFVYKCPYCSEDNYMMFGEALYDLMRDGVADFRCEYCKSVFVVKPGKEKYEVYKKEDMRNEKSES